MKVTVVPAQITTVEDRIAGSLGLNQLLLLSVPIFGGSALYIILPPSLHSAIYKLAVIAILALASGILAIRIKGKILLLWLVVIWRYNLRPRYYLFNKNATAHRDQFDDSQLAETEPEADTEPVRHRSLSPLNLADTAHLLDILENPSANLTFKTNPKGGLYVLITQVKD